MAYPVRCQVCNMYLSLDTCRAYSLRYPDGSGGPRIEAVDLGDREPWAGIRLVCKPCLAFLRTLDPPDEVRTLRLLEAYVEGIDRAVSRVPSSDDRVEMAIRTVADDLRAILGAHEPPGGAVGPGEPRSSPDAPGEAPRGS